VPDHFKRQSQSAFNIPTVEICSLVMNGREKTGQQVMAVRAVKLDGVATGFLGPSSSLTELPYNLINLVNSQFLRDRLCKREDGMGEAATG
jgi:hypothetical protein